MLEFAYNGSCPSVCKCTPDSPFLNYVKLSNIADKYDFLTLQKHAMKLFGQELHLNFHQLFGDAIHELYNNSPEHSPLRKLVARKTAARIDALLKVEKKGKFHDFLKTSAAFSNDILLASRDPELFPTWFSGLCIECNSAWLLPPSVKDTVEDVPPAKVSSLCPSAHCNGY